MAVNKRILVLFTVAGAIVCLRLAYDVLDMFTNPIRSLTEVPTRGPGTYTRLIRFDGLNRTYRFHIPHSYDARMPTPLILAFHGGFGRGRDQAKLSNLDDVSDRNGFIVIYPDGVARSWNAGHETGAAERQYVDDVGFVSTLIDEFTRAYHIDQRGIYATGMSNGAIFVHRLACELSDKIAAIAAVAGSIAPKIARKCIPRRPVSVMQIHGTADQWAPWEGGQTKGGGQIRSVSETIHLWIELNSCSPTPTVTDLGEGVSLQTYAACKGGTEVTLYRIDGGGHTWPGGYQYLPQWLVGTTNRAMNASEVIWDFFVKHPMEER